MRSSRSSSKLSLAVLEQQHAPATSSMRFPSRGATPLPEASGELEGVSLAALLDFCDRHGKRPGVGRAGDAQTPLAELVTACCPHGGVLASFRGLSDSDGAPAVAPATTLVLCADAGLALADVAAALQARAATAPAPLAVEPHAPPSSSSCQDCCVCERSCSCASSSRARARAWSARQTA